jgi:hypothetical protein
MSVIDFSLLPADDVTVRNAAIGAAGPGDVVNAGWIPPHERDDDQKRAAADAEATIPALVIRGRGANEDATKVCLWDCWEPALGRKYLGVHQITGSCVGAGGGNALFSLAAADKVKRKDREKVVIPFWLYPYGISRMLAGMNRRGDGSMGSTFARAVREYGHIPADTKGLPAFKEGDGIVWGQGVELDWSVGKDAPREVVEASKIHLVKSTAQCRTTDDVRDAIKNYYPCTCASNWGGLMRCPVKEGVLLNRRSGTWSHQMSVHAWWDHPKLGELFWIQNQWGLSAHGECPTGAPHGGFWVQKKDMQDICSQREVFAFSEFDGFPSLDEPLSFDLL